MKVKVRANILGLPGDGQRVLDSGADGIGLFRTEFIFARKKEPTEEEQYKAYREVFSAMGENDPITVRTLDIGGDKPVKFVEIPKEDNPFLGMRGIRIGLNQPKLLSTQIRALLRAGYDRYLRIIFPMISTVNEIISAVNIFNEVNEDLRKAKLDYCVNAEVGTMIETPSAAITAEQFVVYTDFFSIGTNDLTQYTLAADRGNPAVINLYDSLHPSVLRLISYVINSTNNEVGVCGEMASDPIAVPILLGLGLTEFSVNLLSVAEVKRIISICDIDEAEDIAYRALDMDSAEQIRAMATDWQFVNGISKRIPAKR